MNAKSDSAAGQALAAAHKRGEKTYQYLKKQIADFKTKVPKSGANDKIKAWALKAVDEGLKKVEDLHSGINIFNNMAKAKIAATKSVLDTRKKLGKELYLAKTKKDIDDILVKGGNAKVTIKKVLTDEIVKQIGTGKHLKSPKPKDQFGPRNAQFYLTSQLFM